MKSLKREMGDPGSITRQLWDCTSPFPFLGFHSLLCESELGSVNISQSTFLRTLHPGRVHKCPLTRILWSHTTLLSACHSRGFTVHLRKFKSLRGVSGNKLTYRCLRQHFLIFSSPWNLKKNFFFMSISLIHIPALVISEGFRLQNPRP